MDGGTEGGRRSVPHQRRGEASILGFPTSGVDGCREAGAAGRDVGDSDVVGTADGGGDGVGALDRDGGKEATGAVREAAG